ncbi:hypothetical protein OUZ56_004340 [Daphnia magna]|uniref:Glutamate receptor ionotropic, kainate n=1 Tax=Daphnia magna TaxID=35525 RepID=A0ABQ9YPM6_9CRUS|nr:hypothetical protein OUZ56_004340 [Daphnia magna]
MCSLRLFLVLGLVLVVHSIDPIRVLLVHETNNVDVDRAFTAVQSYLERTKVPGLSLGIVSRVVLDSTQKYLTVDDVCSLYDKSVDAGIPPHLVLDFTWAGLSSEVMKALTRNLGLPTISGSYGGVGDLKQWSNIDGNQTKYLVQVMPPSDIIPQLIALVTSMQNMTNAAILYDDSFDVTNKYKSLLKNRPIRHMFSRIETNINTQIRRLEDMDIVNYFILGKVDRINQVLMAAAQENYFGKKYSWCALSKDGSSEPFVRTENGSILFATPTINPDVANGILYKTSGLNTGYSVDTGFYFDMTLRALTAVKNMIEANTWPTDMIYPKCSSSDIVATVRENLDLRKAFTDANVGTTFAKLMLNGNGKSYPQVEMTVNQMNFKNSRLESKNALGIWKAGMPGEIAFAAGQSIRPLQVISVFKIAVVVQAPFIMKRNSNGTVEFYGYCVDLIKDIQAIMGFEYELYEVPDGKYGNMDSKMNWNGMIKELMEKRADIGLGALAVMAERENVIDFTVPYYDLVGISILMAKPQVSTSLFKFLTVLENDVWGCILAAYFFTSILLWIFDRWSPYSYQNNKEKYADDPEEEKREFSLKESLWFCMTSLTPQGGGESPKHLSGRLIAATWWLFGFIIIASYTANLAAFLTVSRLDSPVNSLDDLSTQYKVQYAPQNGTDVATYFERMAYIEKRFYEIWKDMSLNDSMNEVERSKLAVWDYPVSDKYTKIWQSMQDAALPQTFEEALTRVRASNAENNDGFAFLGDATDIRYQVLVNCDLQMVGEEFSRKPYAVAVQEGSPLRDLLNDAILRLLNQRRLETLKERWWTDNPEKKECGDTNDQSDGISIQNIGGVFIVIFVGIFLACVTLAIEYCYFKVKRNPEDDQVISTPESRTNATNNRKNLDDAYTKNSQKPYILDDKSRDPYGADYGYNFGAKRELELEGDGPRPRKAW